jgi:osmotically-inducible protein OsmY
MTVSLKHIGNVNDYDVADALTAFARRVAGDGVTVEFAAGAASLSGAVASAEARRALEDLIAAHEGIDSVVNNLAVTPEGARTPAAG